MGSIQDGHDIDALWEYGDPGLSEERFRQASEGAHGDYRLELETQIARSYGLRGRFAEGHALLDAIEQRLVSAGARPRVRYLLERGRTFNSSGEKERARALFTLAWEQAQAANLPGLAVDAVHMLAIVSSGTPEAIEWSEVGLRLAKSSEDAKARALIPAMLNNCAWELHETGRFEQALLWFQEAEDAWRARNLPQQIRVARWSVARCLRSLGRHEEALVVQRELEAEYDEGGAVDGYVFEELGELLSVLGRGGEAVEYFGKAYDALSKDEWFVEHEAFRLARLQERAGGT